MLNKIIALAIAAGFATASFAQSNTPAPAAAPAAKTAPAAAAEPVKAEAVKADAPKAGAKVIKVKHHGKKAGAAKIETPASASK